MQNEICCYIQKNTNNIWEDILLYKRGLSPVGIWACEEELFKNYFDHFEMNITYDEIENLAIITGWKEVLHLYRAISLSKLKYLAIKSDFFANLVNEIECYLKFADKDDADTDNIRIIAFTG